MTLALPYTFDFKEAADDDLELEVLFNLDEFVNSFDDLPYKPLQDDLPYKPLPDDFDFLSY